MLKQQYASELRCNFLFGFIRVPWQQRLLAPVRLDFLRHLPHPLLHCQKGHIWLRRDQQCLSGIGVFLHHWDCCFCLWTSCYSCSCGCDQVGSLWSCVGQQRCHFPHNSRLLPRLWRKRWFQLGTVVAPPPHGKHWVLEFVLNVYVCTCVSDLNMLSFFIPLYHDHLREDVVNKRWVLLLAHRSLHWLKVNYFYLLASRKPVTMAL